MSLVKDQNLPRDANVEFEPCPSTSSNIASRIASVLNRKRRRLPTPEHAEASSNIPSPKRPRKQSDLIEYWRRELHWPREFFEPVTMNYPPRLPRKKSSSSFRGQQWETGSSAPSFTTPSDQKPRELKSAPYVSSSYTIVLATKGSFLDKSDQGITDESKEICKLLLEREQTVPAESIFRDDVFETAYRKLQDKNEARVVQDIGRLIVPSAETLATFGSTHLDILIESVNEGWNSIIPFYGPRPQPDYSVGFKRNAFTHEQLEKIKPLVGELAGFDLTYFMATKLMYFPFLTSEVKCGATALDIADRQNAHSMTVAMRGIVELFRLVKRENEVHREILAFSVSHDHRNVRLYGHYPIIDGGNTTFYRHLIHDFNFTVLDGKDKWTAYRFTKNIYDIWMPIHFKRLCSVIESLPSDLNFEPSELGEYAQSGLSQGLESHHVSIGGTPAADDDQSSLLDRPHSTPDTSFSQSVARDGDGFKKSNKRSRQ